MQVPRLILQSLEELGTDDFKKFQWNLNQPVLDGCRPIPKSRLENKNWHETVSRMIDSYGEESAVDVTVEILKRMNLNNEAEKLQNARPAGSTAAQPPPPTPSSSSSSSGRTPAAGATVSAHGGSIIVAPNITGSSAGVININIHTPNARPGPRAEIQQDRVPADEKLFSVRVQFINRVSDSSLNQLLDKLLERRVITDAEMESARTKHRADKAQDVIDTVRRKGSEPSSVLISALREVDPCLYRALNFS